MTHTDLTPLVNRRTVLGGSAAVLVATSAGLGSEMPTASAARPDPTTYAFFTDPHADPENAVQMARLKATLEAIAADEPALVLHAGDVTEYGTVAEYEAYEAVIPDSIKDKVEHVPGNHEIRWDVTAYENYTEHVDELNFEVTVGGVQFLLLDPTIVQQEVGYYTEADLDWLRRRLRAKPAHQPTVIVTHYPTAEGHYYVVNAEELLATIEGWNVRLVLAGHTHRQHVEHLNGLTHLEGAAVKNAAQYYRLTTAPVGNRQTVASLQHVLIPDPADPATQTVTDLADIDLERQPRRDPLDPRTIDVRVRRNELHVSVRGANAPAGTTARASLYSQQIYAGRVTEAWVPLARTGSTFSGTVDISDLTPGDHRLNVELVDGVRRWREVVAYTINGPAYRPVWEMPLGGIITGALGQLGDRVFAGSSAGSVTAVDPGLRLPAKAWSTEVGPALTNLTVDEAAELVVVGSANGTVTALHADAGGVAWRTDLGHPVMADPLVATIAGEPSVVVMAADELVRLDATTGTVRFRRALSGVSAGRPAADDDRIYVGLGDGKAWAVDAATGEPVWSRELANRAGSYRKLIYGPWTHQVTLITPELVFVSTVAGGRALDRAAGEIVWEIAKSFLYTPPRILADGDLLLVDEWGEARRVDATTGETRWLTDRFVSRSLDAGPVVTGDSALVVGTMGDLAVLDLSDGSYEKVRQLSSSPVVSSPAAANGVLVTGHLDGVLRGFRG
ncbi:PQQ-binding-like beta-propeller repeat protein [Microlunatus sp. Y2014]|uniref:outer membrane protein assembly factor BamB family protein n=1 Tax=Microlunatus sp. Y2014 TaxID=3418488 RepID=UPI003DA707F6